MQDDSPGRRAAAYWFSDGLPEIVTGAEFALCGAGLMLVRDLSTSILRATVAFGYVLLFLCLLNGWDRGVTGFLKSRVTYPRTGYARPPVDLDRVYSRQIFTLLHLNSPAGAPDANVTQYYRRTVFVLLLAGYLSESLWRHWLPAIVLGAAAGALYALHRNGERSYSWWSVLVLPVAGLLVLRPTPPQYYNRAVVWIIEGLWLAGVGACRFARYLYDNPMPRRTEGVCL